VLIWPFAAAAFVRSFPDRPTRLPALRRLAYWPKFGLSYNKVKKNANTSVVLLLDHLQHEGEVSRRDAKWRTFGLFDVALSELGRLAQYHYFIVIRDPYSRVLSAFLDKFRHEEFWSSYGDFPLDPDGFDSFLAWLKAGGLNKDPHWDLQIKLMVWPLEKYDTVIRFENFAAEMHALFESRNIQISAELLEDVLPSDHGKKTSAADQLDRFYTPARRQLVAELFRDDFDALGYRR